MLETLGVMSLREGKKKNTRPLKQAFILASIRIDCMEKKKTKNTAWPVTLISLDIKYIYVSIL